MSRRLELILDDAELEDIQRMARERRISASEWVRQTLFEIRPGKPAKSPEEKLTAIRQAASHSFPTADIEQMLAEIEQGYRA
jgi:hypothetical protein